MILYNKKTGEKVEVEHVDGKEYIATGGWVLGENDVVSDENKEKEWLLDALKDAGVEGFTKRNSVKNLREAYEEL